MTPFYEALKARIIAIEAEAAASPAGPEAVPQSEPPEPLGIDHPVEMLAQAYMDLCSRVDEPFSVTLIDEARQSVGAVPQSEREGLDDETLRLYDTVAAMRAVIGHDHIEPWPCPVKAVDDALSALAHKHGLWDRPTPADLADNIAARLASPAHPDEE